MSLTAGQMIDTIKEQIICYRQRKRILTAKWMAVKKYKKLDYEVNENYAKKEDW